MALKLSRPARRLGVPGDPFRNLNAMQSRKMIERLNQQISGIKGRTGAGLMAGAKEVLKVAIPLTPKDTGYLRSTAYRRLVKRFGGGLGSMPGKTRGKKGLGPVVEIGYGRRGGVQVELAKMGRTTQFIAASIEGAKPGTRAAVRKPKIGKSEDYAVYVHEIPKRYKKGQWKYLETALRLTQKAVLKQIQKRAKVGSGGGGQSLMASLSGLLGGEGGTP